MVMTLYGFPTQLCGVAIMNQNAGQRKYSIFESLTQRMGFCGFSYSITAFIGNCSLACLGSK